jgi:hypothetical protein
MSRSALTFLPKNKQVAGMAIGAIAMLAMAVPALAQEAPKFDEVFTLTTAIGPNNTGIGNPGGVKTFFSFDISWIDPVLKKYFLADRSNKAIDVVDPTNNSIKQFVNTNFAGFTGNNDTSGPDGVVTVHEDGVTELWVGDTGPGPGPGRVWVLDAQDPSKNILGGTNTISVGGTTRADELCFDPQDHLIMIASPGEGDPTATPPTFPYVTFISTAGSNAHKVVGKLVFDGGTAANGLKATNGLEQCGFSPKTGKFYQNVPEDNGPGDDSKPGAVAVIDPTTMTVEKTLPVDFEACAGPQGMAIGPNNQILLGCSAPSSNGHRNTAIINANSGAVLAVFADLGGADEVWFNEGDGHYFIPGCNTECRAKAPPMVSSPPGQELLGVIDSRGFRPDQTVVIANKSDSQATGTSRRIHSVAADPDTKQVYVPIPAIGGGNPVFAPTLCSSAPKKVDTPTDAGGCIAVFATTNNDLSSVAQERAADAHQE